MIRTLRLTAVAVTVLCAATTTVVASADTTPTPRPAGTDTLNACKQAGNTAITNRITVLNDLASRVNAAKDLTSTHRSALTTLISNDKSGLTQLDATIQADTTLSQCRTDVQSIVTAYRVYVLVVPQVHQVIAADVLSTVDTTFAGLEGPLGTAIQNANLNNGQRQRAEDALHDFTGNVTAAGNDLQGQADLVLSLTPTGYPGTTTTLHSTHAKLEAAHDALQRARGDFDTIAGILDMH